MDDGIFDEGGLGCFAIRNPKANRPDCDSEIEDNTSRSGRGGPRLDEHIKRGAGNKSASDFFCSGAPTLVPTRSVLILN